MSFRKNKPKSSQMKFIKYKQKITSLSNLDFSEIKEESFEITFLNGSFFEVNFYDEDDSELLNQFYKCFVNFLSNDKKVFDIDHTIQSLKNNLDLNNNNN